MSSHDTPSASADDSSATVADTVVSADATPQPPASNPTSPPLPKPATRKGLPITSPRKLAQFTFFDGPPSYLNESEKKMWSDGKRVCFL